jgi:threonine/homoserine efflux transporter RhtA
MTLRGPMSSPRWLVWLDLVCVAVALSEAIRLAWAHDPIGIGVALSAAALFGYWAFRSH